MPLPISAFSKISQFAHLHGDHHVVEPISSPKNNPGTLPITLRRRPLSDHRFQPDTILNVQHDHVRAGSGHNASQRRHLRPGRQSLPLHPDYAHVVPRTTTKCSQERETTDDEPGTIRSHVGGSGEGAHGSLRSQGGHQSTLPSSPVSANASIGTRRVSPHGAQGSTIPLEHAGRTGGIDRGHAWCPGQASASIGILLR